MDDDKAFEIVEFQAAQRQPIPSKLKPSTDGFSRQEVVRAFAHAFQMIGGVQRMALWANRNEDKFYALYAKLMPSTTVNIGDNAQIVIVHAIQPTKLDEHQDPTDPAT